MGHLCLQGLKDTILNEPDSKDEEGEGRNAEAGTELIQFLLEYSKSLLLPDAADDGCTALRIVREYFAGKGKPRIVNLNTELTSLLK